MLHSLFFSAIVLHRQELSEWHQKIYCGLQMWRVAGKSGWVGGKCVCLSVCAVCMSVCVHVCVLCAFVCVCVCMRVCIYVCVCACIMCDLCVTIYTLLNVVTRFAPVETCICYLYMLYICYYFAALNITKEAIDSVCRAVYFWLLATQCSK